MKVRETTRYVAGGRLKNEHEETGRRKRRCKDMQEEFKEMETDKVKKRVEHSEGRGRRTKRINRRTGGQKEKREGKRVEARKEWR